MPDENKIRDVYTSFGTPIKPIYTREDIADIDPDQDIGLPGKYPYTRSIFPHGYREQLWTRRLYSGMSTSEDTNARFKYLLEQGQTGLSMALDLPTQLGLDSDDPAARNDVGRLGVAIDTLADMEDIFRGIPLDKINTSFTINATAAIILAMYVVTAEKQGVARDRIAGTVQNDMLKEFLARGLWIFPPGPSLRLSVDIIEYCTKEVPRFNPISISGTHISECQANSAQVIAYSILNGLTYIDEMIKRGYHVDDFAPQLAFHMPSGGTENYSIWEVICKLRAARKLWARLLKERYGAQNPKSMRFKFSTGAGGSGLMAAEPLVNISRLTLYATAAVLAGTRSMNLGRYDEAFAIPTADADYISLMIQQMLAFESGLPDTVDPLGGSYFVEALTRDIEKETERIILEIEGQGGMVNAIHDGSIQRQLARQSYETERRMASGDLIKVGVNKFVRDHDYKDIEMYEMDPKTLERQLSALARIKAERDGAAVEVALRALEQAAGRGDNLMPAIMEAVKAYASVGEIVAVMKRTFGVWREPTVV